MPHKLVPATIVPAPFMAEGLSDEELGRRLNASRGYCRENLRQFAERIKANRHDLSRWEDGDFGSSSRFRLKEKTRAAAVKSAEEASGLPPEFFSVSFDALAEAWRRCGGDDSTTELPEPPGTPKDLVPKPDRGDLGDGASNA